MTNLTITGYDGAGRMITKRYLTGGINDTTHAYNSAIPLVGDATSFDRAGNKLYERHLAAEDRSHLYQPFNTDGSFGVGYDSANRLLQYQRGVLNGDSIPFRVNPGASIDIPTTLPGADQVRTYGLDGLGNWKTSNSTLVGAGGTTTSTAETRQHNYVNEITSLKDTTGSTTTKTGFAYDKNGNLLNDGIRIYQYDAFNRLIQINDAAHPTVILATYTYDAFNRRTFKNITDLGGGVGGVTGDVTATSYEYVYDGRQLVAEVYFETAYFWGQYIDELMFLAPNYSGEESPVYRVLSDLLYRSVAIVDSTSNVITEAYDTDAYGNTLCYSGPGPDGLWFTDDDVRTNNPINTTIFTGREFDPESLIYNYRARYYSPSIGRFISRDSLENAELSQGMNLFQYVGGNSPNMLDPSGLSFLENFPFFGALEQAIMTLLLKYPGMHMEDYKKTACEGDSTLCSYRVNQAAFWYTVDLAKPNIIRWFEDFIMDWLGATVPFPILKIVLAAGAASSLADIAVQIWGSNKIIDAEHQAINEYCCDNGK